MGNDRKESRFDPWRADTTAQGQRECSPACLAASESLLEDAPMQLLPGRGTLIFEANSSWFMSCWFILGLLSPSWSYRLRSFRSVIGLQGLGGLPGGWFARHRCGTDAY